MPFLKLQPDELVRLNNGTTETSAGPEYVNSLSCHLINFSFEDPYDVKWQRYACTVHREDGKCFPFDSKDKISSCYDYIYDNRMTPFGPNSTDSQKVTNGIFQKLADRKSFFPEYTGNFGQNIQTVTKAGEFLDYVFDAFYRQSFYRYARFKLFKKTTELSEKFGFYKRQGLWGYFKKSSPTDTLTYNYGNNDTFKVKNTALASRTAVWNSSSDYVNWINANVNVFRSNPGWVGKGDVGEYRGWLKLACTATGGNEGIREYYSREIGQHESELQPVQTDKVEMAEVLNELYENLTQINRFVSRELSLLFEMADAAETPPNWLVDSDGKVTVTYSAENCFNASIPAKLGTGGYKPLLNNQSNNPDFSITYEYGSTYQVADYERMLKNVGRDGDKAFPVITEYDNGSPSFYIAKNPYDPYQNPIGNAYKPQTTDMNNGRAKNNGTFEGTGLWSVATALKTKNSDNVTAYEPDGTITTQPYSDCLATAYAHWAESQYYNNGSRNENFEVFTVSNIKSEPQSGYGLINSSNPNFVETGSNFYPQQNCNSRFPHYMRVKLRAVANKKYYPVYDTKVSEKMLDVYVDHIEARFSAADIKTLRTGINPGRATINPSDGDNRCINEDPYYMKYGAYYKEDSDEERADQQNGGSRPVVDDDTQWKKVGVELKNPSRGWHGRYFERNLGLYYMNPVGDLFELRVQANVSQVSFLLKSDIYLNFGYSFTSKITYTVHGRMRDGCPELALQNLDGTDVLISKGTDALTLNNAYFKLPLFNDSTSINNLGDQTTPAATCWNNLLDKIHTLYPGSGDTASVGSQPSDVGFVFWMNHRVSFPSEKHTITSPEHFYIVLKGFYFDLTY